MQSLPRRREPHLKAWNNSFAPVAINHYIANARQRNADAYSCYRVIERHNRTLDAASRLRCLKRLIKLDPYCLLVPATVDLYALSEMDASSLERHIIIDDVDAQNFARGKVFNAVGLKSKPPSKAALQRSIQYLLKISEERRDADTYLMLIQGYEKTEPSLGVQYYEPFLNSHAPEWRAFPLVMVLGPVVARRDFETYERFRDVFYKLPENAHICECYYNSFHNWEGIWELSRGRLDEVQNHLQRSQSVRGCPHLNSGGFELSLIEKLLEEKMLLPEVKSYLQVAAKFATSEKLKALALAAGEA
jgi:hypothetical protein